MKICFLIDSLFSFGGVQRVSAVIAKELAREHEVCFMTFDKEEAKDTSLYGLDEAKINYEFVEYPKVGTLKTLACKTYSFLYRKLLPKRGIFNRWYAHSSFPSERRRYLERRLQAGNYDVIVGVHVFLAARLASMRSALGSACLIGWAHNNYEALFGADSKYFLGPVLAPYYVEQFQALDYMVVLTHGDARIYEKRHRFKPTVIYNPLTLEVKGQSVGTSKKFLAVGRMSKGHKGFDILIDAFHLFTQREKEEDDGGQWTLDIVGDGPEHDNLQQQIDGYGLQQRITLHPFTNDIQHYYREAQMYVLSSRWEGFGLVIVEAMAHGVPVLSSDIPTSRELLGSDGHFFRNGDAADLARLLQESIHYPWAEESTKALALAQHFDVKKIVTQWEEMMAQSGRKR